MSMRWRATWIGVEGEVSTGSSSDRVSILATVEIAKTGPAR